MLPTKLAGSQPEERLPPGCCAMSGGADPRCGARGSGDGAILSFEVGIWNLMNPLFPGLTWKFCHLGPGIWPQKWSTHDMWTPWQRPGFSQLRHGTVGSHQCAMNCDGRQPKPCESSSESWMKVVHGSFQSNLRAPHFLVSFNIVHFFHIFSTLTVRQPYCQLGMFRLSISPGFIGFNWTTLGCGLAVPPVPRRQVCWGSTKGPAELLSCKRRSLDPMDTTRFSQKYVRFIRLNFD